MVAEGRAQYASPTSMIVAGKMMLEHVGYVDRAKRLDMALDICGQYEKKLVMISRPGGRRNRLRQLRDGDVERPQARRGLAAVRKSHQLVGRPLEPRSMFSHYGVIRLWCENYGDVWSVGC